MKFFVYFDAYGNMQRIASAKELEEQFDNSTDALLRFMNDQAHSAGQIGVFSYETEEELREFLKTQADVVSEFYESTSECRSYNF
ncbi:MAG: hypothetical protein EHM45_20580 [Desulfobacteraceae bacterium]|nr:MAG: hypothetical protein EHM45_20580 [Desulfobacteraceae bacterium]